MVIQPPRPSLLSVPMLLTLTAALATMLAATPAGAQEGTTIGLGFGPITSYPEDFAGGGCDSRNVGFNLGARRAVASSVALEASVAWTGSVSTSCAADALSLPAPLDGETYHVTILPEAIPGETFWATRVGTVVTPWQFGQVTPLLRLSAGRLWSKELWTWTWGAGVRYAFGRQGIVVDFERWNLGYDVVEESWVHREAALDQLQTRETVQRRPRPWFVRVGWELSVGR